MSSLPSSTFCLTELKNQGAFLGTADFLLTPCRYLFGGRTIEVIGDKAHHVASFHPFGEQNRCATNSDLHSSEMSLLRTVLAIICLVPGFFLGVVLKAIGGSYTASYREACMVVAQDLVRPVIDEQLSKVNRLMGALFSGKPLNSDMVMPSLDMIDPEWLWRSRILNIRSIGSLEMPMSSPVQLGAAVNNLEVGQSIDILVVYSDKKWNINSCAKILELNPMKVVLINAKLSTPASARRLGDPDPKIQATVIPMKPLREEMEASGKWLIQPTASLSEALKTENPVRSWLPYKRWHVVHEVERTLSAPVPSDAHKRKTGVHTLSSPPN